MITKKKDVQTLSNCDVMAPGKGNIRPSSKNSPGFAAIKCNEKSKEAMDFLTVIKIDINLQ